MMIEAGLQPTKNFSAVSRLVLRRDGFVSARTPVGGGEFTTELLTFTGSELVLNVDTSATGNLHCELLDEKDAAHRGPRAGGLRRGSHRQRDQPRGTMERRRESLEAGRHAGPPAGGRSQYGSLCFSSSGTRRGKPPVRRACNRKTAPMKTERTAQLPLFYTHPIGSLPRPQVVLDLLARRESMPADEFNRVMDGMVAFAIQLQEQAGLDVVSDGEWRRVQYIREFLQRRPSAASNASAATSTRARRRSPTWSCAGRAGGSGLLRGIRDSWSKTAIASPSWPAQPLSHRRAILARDTQPPGVSDAAAFHRPPRGDAGLQSAVARRGGHRHRADRRSRADVLLRSATDVGGNVAR